MAASPSSPFDPVERAVADIAAGPIFPPRARAGGVLERAGHTEAAVDLAVPAGRHPSGVLCELMNDDGTLARRPQLQAFRERFGLRMISIELLARYRETCCGLAATGSVLDPQ